MIAYSNGICAICKEEGILHQYKHRGNTWTDWLHQSNDGHVLFCGTSKRLNVTFADFFNENSSFWGEDDDGDILEQAQVRRRKYWQNRQLPPRYRYTPIACSSSSTASTATAPVGDHISEPKQQIVTQEHPSEEVIITETPLATTTNIEPETDPLPTEPTKTVINNWADFWRCDIGVNVIPANTKKKKHMNPGKSGKTNQSQTSYIMNGKHQAHLTMA
jgi:hypothetical protein